jgi:hypothetical protein
MNLFYKIHLQAFNVTSIVFYHSGPMFGQILYFCLDAFIVDASDYSGHLIRHLLNASEAFPTLTCSEETTCEKHVNYISKPMHLKKCLTSNFEYALPLDALLR